jgi:hypothetical protein
LGAITPRSDEVDEAINDLAGSWQAWRVAAAGLA